MRKKHKQKRLSDKKWRKLLRAKESSILTLMGNQEFCVDGSIRIQPTTPTPCGSRPIYADHGVSLWDMLGFKRESTPGETPGVYHHTFTDNTSLGYWLKQSEEEEKEQEERLC